MFSETPSNSKSRTAAEIPARAGAGLKPEHVAEILETGADVGFFFPKFYFILMNKPSGFFIKLAAGQLSE